MGEGGGVIVVGSVVGLVWWEDGGEKMKIIQYNIIQTRILL